MSLYVVLKRYQTWDFPDGPVVKNPPANAQDTDSIPVLGTKIPHATGQLSPGTLEPVFHNKRVAPVYPK